MGDQIKKLFNTNVTVISNEFLSKCLADINGEFLRVYLYILWKSEDNLNFRTIADELNLCESDVERAIKYLVKQQNLSLNDVMKNENNKETSVIKNSNNKTNLVDFNVKKNEIIKDNDFNDILYFAEKMFVNFSSKQQNLINDLYYNSNFSKDLIMFLIEYCAENNKTTSEYITAVANNWLESGVVTVEDAKKHLSSFNNKKTNSIKAKIKKDTSDIDYDALLMKNSMEKINK